MARAVIRLGDDTSHGGKVITASARMTIDGIPVALWGDRCSCPIDGHDTCVICEGEPEALYDGIPVALEGHKTDCGAVLIPTQLNRCNVSPLVKADAKAPASVAPVKDPKKNRLFKGMVRFVDKHTKKPLKGSPYRLVDKTSKEVLASGVSDAEGLTTEIVTKKGVPFEIHFGGDYVSEQQVGSGVTKTSKKNVVDIEVEIRKLFVIMYYTKLNHDDGAFKNAAETKKREIEVSRAYDSGRDRLFCYSISHEDDLKQKWIEILAMETSGLSSVEEMHLFTHASKGSANGDGIELMVSGSNNGTLEKQEIEALPKLFWMPSATLTLYGCNTGIRGAKRNWSIAEAFASTQRVKTLGQSGYAYFSKKRDVYEENDHSSSRLYLWAFRRRRNGMTGNGEKMEAITCIGKQP